MNIKPLELALLIFFLISFSSCYNKPISNSEIDKFIARYDSVNFNAVKGISISIRSGGLTDVVYVIDKSGGNQPVYFVTVNNITGSITKINRDLLKRDSIPDYLTENELSNAVREIRRYKFCLLTVDSLENVFINPFRVDEPAFFLRLKNATGDSAVRKAYAFTLYKRNWYVNRRD